ncbi:pseudouridine synthase [Mongoliibacter ruber]|uniref:tRNA pseudouridine synthase C n=1 Tax=Mongoliibacter ruber TaxID=1750599 RepID=A0A2T0WVR8_9BACT|nr:pseudouridine synthase [Mongoliibacter ruber]PRY90793.1 tRNA pseudouridine65 synthase [Mongoliibacter ruber]
MRPLLTILYEDEYFIAIDKPAGVLVHKTNIAKEEEELLAVQMLRDQINCRVYPLHRIDRPTTGVLIFGKSSEAASLLQPLFPTDAVEKEYLTVVRGFMPTESGEIESPLKKNLVGELQEALTLYTSIAQTEIPFPSSPRYPTSRYSLIKAFPKTGRMHQIRRHMAHIRHYIIGDSTHGDNKQNNFFRSQYGLQNMLLHAYNLRFNHPIHKIQIEINAPLPKHFLEITDKIGLDTPF